MTVAVRGTAAAVLFALVVLAAATLRVSAQRRAPADVDDEVDVPPIPGDVARALTFGFRPLLADLTLLQAIQLLPQRNSNQPDPTSASLDRRLVRLLEYSVDVDPQFAGAYHFTAAALPHETLDGKVYGVIDAVRILQKGLQERPDDWRMGFLLGFLQSYYLHEFAAAAHSFSVAARRPEAPAFVGFLATRLAAQEGDLPLATSLAEAMLGQATEEETRKAWQERVAALHMERDLRAIEDAVRRYREERGSLPRSVQALVAAGLLPAAPREPHGGHYVIDADGTVRSTASERLRAFGVRRYEVH